jgi:ribonuclease PH
MEGLEGIGEVPPDVLHTQVAAVSLGLVDGELLLDLCYEEDSAASADFNIVMTADGYLVEVQGTAEGDPFSRGSLDAVLDLAEKGIDRLLAAQRRVIQDGLGASL